MADEFPIVRTRPGDTPHLPVVASIPHGGIAAPPDVTEDVYIDPRFRPFRIGYADAYAEEIYGALHTHGATVITTPYSRLFVDLNRPRDNFQVIDNEVISQKGVFRTHTIFDDPVFARPLSEQRAKWLLTHLYDPYYARLELLLDEAITEFGSALLLDCHTGSPRRLKEHQIVLGTGRGRYCSLQTVEAAEAIVRTHGFECTVDLSGYTGGAVVRRFGEKGTRREALQIELNANLVMRCERREYSLIRYSGGTPPYDAEILARLQALMADITKTLGGARTSPNFEPT